MTCTTMIMDYIWRVHPLCNCWCDVRINASVFSWPRQHEARFQFYRQICDDFFHLNCPCIFVSIFSSETPYFVLSRCSQQKTLISHTVVSCLAASGWTDIIYTCEQLIIFHLSTWDTSAHLRKCDNRTNELMIIRQLFCFNYSSIYYSPKMNYSLRTILSLLPTRYSIKREMLLLKMAFYHTSLPHPPP